MTDIRIYYGSNLLNIVDVTDKIYRYAVFKNDDVTLPAHDLEVYTNLFGDHAIGHIKYILVIKNNRIVFVGAQDKDIRFTDMLEDTKALRTLFDKQNYHKMKDPNARLTAIHSKIITFGSNLYLEYDKQLMSCTHIEPNDVVLEIGSNVGRNTLVIASLLKIDHNIVTLETDENMYNYLLYNKTLNRAKFHARNEALSKQRLVRRNDAVRPLTNDTMLEDGWTEVKTCTLEQIEAEYGLTFNVVVVNCDVSFPSIIKEFPTILDNVRLILMENNYTEIEPKEELDKSLRAAGFECAESKPGGSGVCKDFFWQAWKKSSNIK